MATKTLARWPRVGGVSYQALPLLRFFTYKIRTREKVRKGEGEPGGGGGGGGGGTRLILYCAGTDGITCGRKSRGDEKQLIDLE